MHRVTRPNQLQLFDELVETETTRDRVDDAGTFIQRPVGRGWRVLNADRERHTAWMRRRPIVLPRQSRRR
jgi:hypothetical protein